MAESAVLRLRERSSVAGSNSVRVAGLFRHPIRDNESDGVVRCREGVPSRKMDPRQLFEANLSTIDRIIARVCWRARIQGADAEDFASTVKVSLLDDDCAILRKHEGRSSIATYLGVVIDRMLTDERVRTLGRWDPSTEAQRLGPAALLIERLLRRDRRSMEEAWPIIRGVHPELTRDDAEQIAARLPERAPRPRFVALEATELPPIAASDRADAAALSADDRVLSERTSHIVRETLSSLPVEELALVQFHYGASMSIADISRMMRLPQRPLYRRIERVLTTLRRALDGAGIDATAIPGLVSHEMNFGLAREEAP